MRGFPHGIATRTRTSFREGPFVLLVSHFLTRFFTGELTAEHSDLRLGIGVILAGLSLPGAFISILLLGKYSSLIRWLYHLPPVDYNTLSIPDKYMFVAYTMTVTGLVAVVIWDRLFPDHLDHANLAPLPLGFMRMFLAKLVALALFFALLVTTLNLGSGVLFPMQVEGNQTSLGVGLRMVLAHMTANVAGGFFAFFVVFSLVGLLTLAVPGRRFRPISFAFQSISTVLLVLLLFATPAVETLLPRFREGAHPLLAWLPTVWFLGLYQDMQGGATPVIQRMAARAVVAFIAAGGASLLLYLASYRRCVRRIRDSAAPEAREPGRLRALVVRGFDRCILGRPFDRACFHFAIRTLWRNRRHSLLMAGFAGLGLAIALQDAAAGWTGAPHASAALPATTLLAAPLAILFFLLTGTRFVFDLPAELSANWTFRMAVRAQAESARRVARKLMLLWIVPIAIASLLAYAAVWGVRDGIAESVFLLLASLVLAELMLLDYAKIPFTSSYAGPKHNAGLTLAIYLLAFFFFSSTLASLEHWTLALPNSVPFLVLIVLLAAGWRVLCYFARARDRSGEQIVFADEPPSAILTIDLR